jgi:O-antigen ligase
MVLSLVWATDPGEGTTALTRYAPNLLLVPIAYTAVRTRRHAVWVLGALVAGGAIAATTGVFAPPADPGLAVAGEGRSTGTIGDANQLAAALVVALALAGAFMLNARMSAGVRLVCAAVALVSLLGIFTSLSRGGLIALGVALVVAVLASGRWRGRAAAAGLAVVSCGVTYFALFASLPARERVTNFGGDGTGRLDLWTIGGRMVADEPLRGVGVGNFPVSSVQYLLRPGAIERPDFIITTPKVAHNTYLQFFAELGAIGGLLFVAIVIYCGVCAMRAVRSFERQGDVSMEILARGLVVALAGYLTAIVFISENYSKLMWILLALGPALLAVSRRLDPEAVTDAPRAPGAARGGAGPP